MTPSSRARAGAALQQTLRGSQKTRARHPGSQLSVNALVSDEDSDEETDPQFEVLAVDLSLRPRPSRWMRFVVVAAHQPKLAANGDTAGQAVTT